jgi:hypothetical protein
LGPGCPPSRCVATSDALTSFRFRPKLTRR